MTEAQLQTAIKEIKQLIVERRFKKAFHKLAPIIEEIDRLDKEDADDKALKNQMLLIESRYHTFNNQSRLGVQTGNEEINQITLSILQFLDDVKGIGTEYIQNKEEAPPIQNAFDPEEKHRPYHATEKTIIPATAPAAPADGCLFAFSNKDTKVNVQLNNFKPLKIILGFLGLLLIAGGFFFFMKGCNDNKLVVDPPKTNPGTPNPNTTTPPAPLGPDAAALGLSERSAEAGLANFLSDPKSRLPSKIFNFDQVRFPLNASQLNAAGKRQLDNLVNILNRYPDAGIDIYGYLLEHETNSGNKEISLDDKRARSVVTYLNSKGIDNSQLNFQGEGLGDAPTVGIRVYTN